MSLLKYFSRESDIDQSTVSVSTGGDADSAETDADVTDDESEQSLEDDVVSEQPFPVATGAVSSGSSSLSDISESEDDPSLPLPV